MQRLPIAIENDPISINVDAPIGKTIRVFLPKPNNDARSYSITSRGEGKVEIHTDPTHEFRRMVERKTFWQRLKYLFTGEL